MIELSGLEADLTRAGGEVPFRGSDIFDAAMPQQGQFADSLIRKFVIYSTKRRIKTRLAEMSGTVVVNHQPDTIFHKKKD